MLKAVKASLAFMTPKERRSWAALTAIKAILSFFDLVAVLAVGAVLTSTALFLTEGSDPNRKIAIGDLEIPAVNAATFPWVAAAVLGLFLSKAAASIYLTKKAAFFVADVEARSAKEIAETIFGGSLMQARKMSREETMFAIGGGSPAAFNSLLNAVNVFFSEAFLFLVICLGFFFVDPIATIAALVYFGLVFLLIQTVLGSKLQNAGELVARSSIGSDTAISNLISVFRELSVLGKKKVFIDRLYVARKTAAIGSAQTYFLSGMPRYIIESALLIGLALFLVAQSLSGDIIKAAGTIGVFLAGGYRLTAALLPLQSSLLHIRSVLPAAATAHLLLAASSARGRPQGVSIHASPPWLGIGEPVGVSMTGATFSYLDSGKFSVRDLSISIVPGSQVALIGSSGAGKSTISDLICGVLEPQRGSVVLTRRDGETSSPIGNGAVSYVPQKPGMVPGTIAENVALGEDATEINRQAVISALNKAHLGEVVESLEHGVDTPLGKLLDGLSGGQLQRLGLARALYTNPGLLILDEATSALDAESESEIYKALEEMRGDVTVVLIAHRLNTIQHADEVFYIENGAIVDSGKFSDLIARNASIKRIVDLMKVNEG